MRRDPLLNRKGEQGFTLIELLVAMAIFLIILGFIFSTVQTVGRTTRDIATSSASQREATNAQNLIAARVREATYIVPNGTQITLPTASAVAPLVRSPAGNSVWTVGTHNIVAFITPPKKVGLSCPSTTPSPSTDGCYFFQAYYTMRRSDWIAATGGTTQPTTENPGESPANDAALVLVEFSAPYIPTTAFPAPGFAFVNKSSQATSCAAQTDRTQCQTTLGAELTPASLTFTDGNVRNVHLLADFLVVNDAATPLFQVKTSSNLIGTTPSYGPGYAYLNLGYVAPYASGIIINMALQQRPGPRLPATGYYSLEMTARNIGSLR